MPAEVVGWTRGQGCAEVASLLAPGDPVRIEGDLVRSCVDARVDMLVARKFSSFDLVPIVVPNGVEVEGIGSVTAAVGEGPHSPLAVDVASRVGERLSVPVELAMVYRDVEEESAALERLHTLRGIRSNLAVRAVRGGSAVELVGELDTSSLLVVGAPGGSWFYRQIYGPGHRLTVAAPAGALLVRSAPRRSFHGATEVSDAVVGMHLSVGDAMRLVGHPVVAVADSGALVGILRASALTGADPAAPVSDIMEPPVAVETAEPLESAEELRDFFEGGPVPVIDGGGRLIGLIPAA